MGLASSTKDILVKTPPAKNSKPAATKVAVITGGARGIGLAIGQHFLAKGYNVALLDIDKKTLAKTKADLNTSSVLTLQCDVSKPEQVKEAISKVAATFGRIDALVNNAGVAIFKPILEVSWKDWRSVMDTNLDGAFLCTQACAKVMLKTGGGAIVNIASISGLRASTLRVAYGTSKGALIHLTKQQAAELGDVGIRVNCVAPGPVLTEMAKLVHSTSIIKDYFDAIPLNRYGTQDEIADAVVYLCSEQASYVNGQVLAVDGGFDATGVGLPNLRQTRDTNKKASKTITKALK
jgi:meso-butanediol dehydrogenase / (S,S)-butanediol dehydrogenase / diacetyl reductase